MMSVMTADVITDEDLIEPKYFNFCRKWNIPTAMT